MSERDDRIDAMHLAFVSYERFNPTKLRPIPNMGPGFYEVGPLLPGEAPMATPFIASLPRDPGDFGMTCPLLNIARHYGEDYETCLTYADALIHKRKHPTRRYFLFSSGGAMAAIEAHADRYNRLCHGLES